MDKPEQPPSPRPKPIYMTIATWIILGTVIAAFLIFKRLNAVKPETAREWLNKGRHSHRCAQRRRSFRKGICRARSTSPSTDCGDEIARLRSR